jgi:predicted phage terminase large subunit-like protein
MGSLTELPLHEPAVRRTLTEHDPMLFAQIYLRKALTGDDGVISFAECHYEWAELAKSWAGVSTVPQANRHAFFAPRATGKSTWWLKILPMWAAAHGHIKFAAIFADSTPQARQHAMSFRRELEHNELLRRDFPDLCTPARRSGGVTESNAQDLIIMASGFSMMSKGIDSSALGMKIGDQRPDLLLIDDPEPDEANYSADQAIKRLGTITDAILPLNIFARVVYSGTVTMVDSIAHQMIKHLKGVEPQDWITEQKIQVHHHEAILVGDDGTERSLWEHKWPLTFLKEIEHTRQYAKNYANDPMGIDGAYWNKDDFTYGEDFPTRLIISIDPAVTVKESSDYTGVAVVGFCAGTRRATVFEALQLKLGPDQLRSKLIRMCEEYEGVSEIIIETNQGGDLWRRILHDMPVKVKPVVASIKKEIRASYALQFYQRGRVLHAKPLRGLEEQMVGFPRAPYDDMVDAVSQGVNRLLRSNGSLIGSPWEMKSPTSNKTRPAR